MSVEKRGSTAVPAALLVGTGGISMNSSMITDEVMLEAWPGQQAHATQFALQVPSGEQHPEPS